MIVGYEKVYVKHVSLEHYSEENEKYEGIALSDNGTQSAGFAGEYDKDYFLKLLTNRQRAVAALLFDGYDRVRIAGNLGVSVQAIHQIIPRIRKRLNQKAGIPLKGWKRRHGGY